MQIICKLGHVTELINLREKLLFFHFFFFPLPFHVIDAIIFNVKCHYCVVCLVMKSLVHETLKYVELSLHYGKKCN